jgi:hypothetical protein
MFMKLKKRRDRAILDNDLKTTVDSHAFGVAVPDQPIQSCAGPSTSSARSTRKSDAPKHTRVSNLTSESLERRVQNWGVWRTDSDACLFDVGGQSTNSFNDAEIQSEDDMSNYFFDQLLPPNNGATVFHHRRKAKSKCNQQADEPRRPSLIFDLSFEGDGLRRPSIIDERPTLGDSDSFENFEQIEPRIRTAASQLMIPVNNGQSLRVLQVDF